MGWGTEPAIAIDSDVKIADPPRTSRNPRKAKASKASELLLEAITFVNVATNDAQEFQKYGRFAAGWLVAFDGSIAAGFPIEEDLAICPHLARLKDAVAGAGATLALTAHENGRLGVNGAKARFTVPCLPGSSLFPVMPDPQVAVLNDALKIGFAAVVALAKEDADTIHEQSVLLRANTIVGCNGQLAMEYYHGIDLPPNLAIPHKAAKAIAKMQRPLTGFGWDEGRSVTFYFDNGAWIKTQVMGGEWPDIDKVLDSPAYTTPCPEDLYEALNTIVSFSDDGAVHFHDDKLKTTYGNTEAGAVQGAAYDVPGLTKGHSFSAKLLKLAQPAAVEIDYTTHADRMILHNVAGNIRGVLMKRTS